MAEQTPSQSDPLAGIDKEALAQYMQEEMRRSFQQVGGEMAQQAQQYIAQQPPAAPVQPAGPPSREPDFWDQTILPRVAPALGQNMLISAATSDKVDFYQSEKWDNFEELIDDGQMTEAELRRAKRQAAQQLEQEFVKSVQNGRATRREDILDLLVGRKVNSDPKAFQERTVAKTAAQKRDDLEKARRGADIGAHAVRSWSQNDITGIADETFDKLWEDFGKK